MVIYGYDFFQVEGYVLYLSDRYQRLFDGNSGKDNNTGQLDDWTIRT